MLARRVALVAPARARNCAFLTKMKAMEAETSKLATTLPDGLKEIAESGTEIQASLRAFAADRPELFKAAVAKIAEADAPGIIATTDVARDPKACKYTEEGTLLHEMMQRVYKSDRRMAALGDLEVTLTAADKAAISASLEGAKVSIPDTMSVSKMMS